MIINKEINFLDKEVTRMGKKLKQTQSSIFGSVGPQNKRHQEEVSSPANAYIKQIRKYAVFQPSMTRSTVQLHFGPPFLLTFAFASFAAGT